MSGPIPAARTRLPAGSWDEPPVDKVTLDYDQRHRRRIAMTAKEGTAFLLDLSEAIVLRDGDGLELEGGGVILVEAAAEPLAEITAPDAITRTRIAWHLGNRHLPTAIAADRFLIRRDHVIEAMVEGLGGTVRHIEAVFDPEGGAYSGGGHHHHAHD